MKSKDIGAWLDEWESIKGMAGKLADRLEAAMGIAGGTPSDSSNYNREWYLAAFQAGFRAGVRSDRRVREEKEKIDSALNEGAASWTIRKPKRTVRLTEIEASMVLSNWFIQPCCCAQIMGRRKLTMHDVYRQTPFLTDDAIDGLATCITVVPRTRSRK